MGSRRMVGIGAAAIATLGAAVAFAGAPGEGGAPESGPRVLRTRCVGCHNAEKKAGGLDLSTRQAAGAALAGADDPAVNRLVRAVTSGRMPPTGKLPAPELAAVRAWVRAGAPYPAGVLAPLSLAEQPLWSLQPVRRAPIPTTRFDRLSPNPVDRFLFRQLERKGLSPSPPAGKLELIRRVTLDLTGLPPSPEDIDAFLADARPDAYERVVDRLLASPAYGERWAQHWLDVVRYGESHGYEQNHLRPNAWPYRDYVIRAFNRDKPFDRFVAEQLAGDVVGRGDPEAEAATGFLVAGIHDTVGNQTEEGTRQQRANDLDDIVSATAESFLGLTAGCAKCHDHKFDPIPQKDYYRLAAVFAGVRHGERVLGGGSAPASARGARWTETFPPVTARFVRLTITATADGAEPCLDELEVYGPDGGPNLAHASSGARASASSLLPGYPIHQVAHLNDGLLGNDHSWISNERGKGWAQIELARPAPVGRVTWSRDASPQARFLDRVPVAYRVEVSEDGQSWKRVAVRGPAPAAEIAPGAPAYAGVFSAPDPVFLLRRGDVMQRAEEVTPAALSCIPALPAELGLSGTAEEPERRLALARWLTDRRNPLTSRVIVNRIWHAHFGRGLVGTPSDFGHNGEKPSHPELLDWLASVFAAPAPSPGGEPGKPLASGLPARDPAPAGLGWSLKKLHRLLVTSYAYRQSSQVDDKKAALDAGNTLIWRMPLRRMDAEAIRDAILATSGKLDRRMGGPGYQLFKYRVVNVAIYEPLEDFSPTTWRRGVYRQRARAIRDDLLGAFDCPESSQRTPRRESTTTALQALSLLNGPFMAQQAGFLAERVEQEAGPTLAARVDRAFRLTFGRAPSPQEARAAQELAASRGLATLCRGLLNANEFLYY